MRRAKWWLTRVRRGESARGVRTTASPCLSASTTGPCLSATTHRHPRVNSFQYQPSEGFYPPAYGSTYPQHPVPYYPPHHGSSYPYPQATHRPIYTIQSMHIRHPKCIHRPWLPTIPLRPAEWGEYQARKMSGIIFLLLHLRFVHRVLCMHLRILNPSIMTKLHIILRPPESWNREIGVFIVLLVY